MGLFTTPPLAAFLQLYDGIGRYELSIELRNLAEESSVAEKVSHLDFPERPVKMDLVLPLDSMRLPRPGRYEIAILLDGIDAATQFIAEVPDAGETQQEE